MTNAAKELLLIALAVAPAMAQSNGRVGICVVAGNEIPTIVLLQAEAITARMFATASVAINWRCESGAVKLNLVTKAPTADLRPDALGYAQLGQGSEIVVMFDRIDRSIFGRDKATKLSNILAHVMTHEITHRLQGIARHSETGVMKAYWSPKDFDEMSYRALPFAPEDIELIRLGMARRSR
jgi:hypothetical protein